MSDLTVLLLHLIIGYIIFHCYRHTDGHTDTASSHSEGFLRNLHKKSLQAMYQGSHVPNFEALGVPKSKCQTCTDRRTDTASSHSEGFLRNLHKKKSKGTLHGDH